ncbi:MAG: hypothetical protein ACOCNL_16865 [Acetivibrio ethanolgignens]
MKAFTFNKRLFVGLLIVLSIAMLTGCMKSNQNGSTVDEPDITVDYLQGEYVQQLMRDGATHVFGNIKISQNEDDETLLLIESKEYVEDETQPNGFYIEDKNVNVEAVLSSEARCTFMQGGVSLPQIMTAGQFVNEYEKDVAKNGGEKNPEYEKYKLYDIYIMEGQAELVLERYIP